MAPGHEIIVPPDPLVRIAGSGEISSKMREDLDSCHAIRAVGDRARAILSISSF